MMRDTLKGGFRGEVGRREGLREGAIGIYPLAGAVGRRLEQRGREKRVGRGRGASATRELNGAKSVQGRHSTPYKECLGKLPPQVATLVASSYLAASSGSQGTGARSPRDGAAGSIGWRSCEQFTSVSIVASRPRREPP